MGVHKVVAVNIASQVSLVFVARSPTHKKIPADARQHIVLVGVKKRVLRPPDCESP